VFRGAKYKTVSLFFFFVGFCLQGGFAVWCLGVLGFCIFYTFAGFWFGSRGFTGLLLFRDFTGFVYIFVDCN
jgi:hypothetical protein